MAIKYMPANENTDKSKPAEKKAVSQKTKSGAKSTPLLDEEQSDKSSK